MATITQTEIAVNDKGSGAGVECLMTVTIGPVTVVHHLATAALGLTAGQLATLQQTMDLLRTRAIAVTKQDFVIP